MSNLNKPQKELKAYLNECFALSVDYTLYWKARPATHFGGSIEKRDRFNLAFAGRGAVKGPNFEGLSVELDGTRFDAQQVIQTMVA